MKFRHLLVLAFSACFSILFAQNSASKSPVPFLGVELDDDSELEEGVLVEGVYRGFGAAEAGLQRGDILLAVNGDDVNSQRELTIELKNFKAGDEVELAFRRFNKPMTARAKLSEKPRSTSELSAVRRAESDGQKKSGKKAYMGIYPQTDWEKGGVRITGFTSKSQAWRAGLEEGDVILKLDDAQVSTASQLDNYLFEKAPGQEMTVVFMRNGKEKSLKMTLGETASGSCDCDDDDENWGWKNGDYQGWEGNFERLGEQMEAMAERIGENGERIGQRGEELAEDLENRLFNRRRDDGRRGENWGGESFFSLRDFSAILNQESGNLTVSFSGRSNQDFAVVVTDEDGKELAREERDELEEGLFTHQFDLSQAGKGSFYVRVWKGDNVVTSERVVRN